MERNEKKMLMIKDMVVILESLKNGWCQRLFWVKLRGEQTRENLYGEFYVSVTNFSYLRARSIFELMRRVGMR